MPLDPIFNVPTEITKGCNVVNPSRSGNTSSLRAEAISKAAYRVRAALFESYERIQGAPADMLPMGEQTTLLMAAFCNRPLQLQHYRCPELDGAIADFRELVPLVPFGAFEGLETAPVRVNLGDGRKLLRLRNDGKISDDELEERARGLAEDAKLEYPEGLPTADAIDQLEHSLIALHKQGTVLKEFATGSESRVYINEPASSVYKALPVRGELLQIPPALHDEDIQATNDYGTFMADAFGGMPLFDRARLLATVAGLCRTELVAVTEGGYAIYKQPYLGEEEPSAAAVEEWAVLHGHAKLPEQQSSDPILSDISRIPFVASGVERGQYVVGMDLNPRNARMRNGVCIPFDPVLRELQPEELASHPRLQAAVEFIEKQRSLTRKSTPSII